MQQIWLGPKHCGILLQTLATHRTCNRLHRVLDGSEGLQQAAAKSGWAPGISARCCKVWPGPWRQRSQQAAAKFAWVPGIAISYCTSGWATGLQQGDAKRGKRRDSSKLSQRLAGRQGLRQATAISGWAQGIRKAAVKSGHQGLQQAAQSRARPRERPNARKLILLRERVGFMLI